MIDFVERVLAHPVATSLAVAALALFAHGASAQYAQDLGAYRVRYSALPTDQLLPAMAKSYGIVRSHDRAIVNIAVQRIASGDASSPIRAAVSGNAVSLGGDSVALKFREIFEEGAASYIAELPVSTPDTYRFTISLTPESETAPVVLKFNQDFVAD